MIQPDWPAPTRRVRVGNVVIATYDEGETAVRITGPVEPGMAEWARRVGADLGFAVFVGHECIEWVHDDDLPDAFRHVPGFDEAVRVLDGEGPGMLMSELLAD
jgi:hypothetical protein